jgi:hypothetical protein
MQISFGMYEDKNRRLKKTMLEEVDKVLHPYQGSGHHYPL